VTTRAALVLDSERPVTIGGLTLTERTVLLAHRTGLHPVYVWGPHPLASASLERLRARGGDVVELPGDKPPFESATPLAGVVVTGPDVLVGPTALADLVACGVGSRALEAEQPAALSVNGVPLLAYLPTASVHTVRSSLSIDAMLAGRPVSVPVRALASAVFCRRVGPNDSPVAVEREYIRHMNGSESYFTKKIRRFSVPFSAALVRLDIRPVQVTLAGFVVAVLSAWCIAQGSYLLGVLGGVLCYASMVFDCSDGEVARLSLRDSAFGAWLETWVDYTTYLLLLVALTLAARGRPGAETYHMAAAIALAGSLVVALVASYLRHRVAAADPGQFDEASAKVMASSNGIHRFARWGRQWIKRSSIAHLVLVLALVNQLPVLLYLWAFGATVAMIVIVAVEPFVVRKVKVTAVPVPPVHAGDGEGVRSCS
jgi:phosphatidylglycerophosphate synthase